MEIYLSNLSADTTAAEVHGFISNGPADPDFQVQLYTVREMPSRQLKGFAYIRCAVPQKGADAMLRCDGKNLAGRSISCRQSG